MCAWTMLAYDFTTTPGGHPVGVSVLPIPAFSRDGASGSMRSIHARDPPSAGRHAVWGTDVVDPRGFEPLASALQRRRSTAELWALTPIGVSTIEPHSACGLGGSPAPSG